MGQRLRKRLVDREKSRPSLFWLLGGIIVPVLGIFVKIEILGEENLPEEGPFVLAPNHYSEIDPLIVAVAVWRLGRAPRFMAKESLFRVPVLGPAMRGTGMVPVARASSSVAAKQTLDTATHLAEHGAGVIVYPEGTLTRDPDLWPMRGKTGAARLALVGDIPLIPVAQWGAQEVFPRYGRMRFWPLRKPIRFLVGAPLDISEERAQANLAWVQTRVTARLMDRIAELLAQLRGIPAPAVRWNPHDHGQKETGRLEPES
ncbi:MAG: lysophospholipid acyltransferase family protein [Microbacterium sp.]|uniref:lysophospholipid acyltransferase family protein n=1 Tax=Microbacterium sp. TaxID=51671 RepID=UPI0039E3B3A0